jgi:hypothetical protein
MNTDKVAAIIVALVALAIAYFAYKDWTYDWSRCESTEIVRKQHRAMWIQRFENNTVIIHPARDWVEQKHYCPEGEKWKEYISPTHAN